MQVNLHAIRYHECTRKWKHPSRLLRRWISQRIFMTGTLVWTTTNATSSLMYSRFCSFRWHQWESCWVVLQWGSIQHEYISFDIMDTILGLVSSTKVIRAGPQVCNGFLTNSQFLLSTQLLNELIGHTSDKGSAHQFHMLVVFTNTKASSTVLFTLHPTLWPLFWLVLHCASQHDVCHLNCPYLWLGTWWTTISQLSSQKVDKWKSVTQGFPDGVSIPKIPWVYLTSLTQHPREQSLDHPQNTGIVIPQVSLQLLSFITHHRITPAPPTKNGSPQKTGHRQGTQCPFLLTSIPIMAAHPQLLVEEGSHSQNHANSKQMATWMVCFKLGTAAAGVHWSRKFDTICIM